MSAVVPGLPTSAASVLVRGGGSIGDRWARVLGRAADDLGIADVSLWPVRPGPRAVPESVRLTDHWPAEPPTLVVIATDTRRHVDDAVEAAEAGARRLLVEKPVGVDAVDGARLSLLADRVSVATPLRFTRAWAELVCLLPEIGVLQRVRVDCGSWLPTWRSRPHGETYSARAAEGGVLRDLVHDLDCALQLAGAPTRVVAVLGGGASGGGASDGGVLGIEAEESADVVWTTTTGTVVSVGLDYTSPRPRRSVELTGTAGALRWDVLTATVSWWDAAAVLVRSTQHPGDLDRDTALVRQAEDVLHRDPAEPFASTFGQALDVMDVVDALRRSDATGLWVTLGTSRG